MHSSCASGTCGRQKEGRKGSPNRMFFWSLEVWSSNIIHILLLISLLLNSIFKCIYSFFGNSFSLSYRHTSSFDPCYCSLCYCSTVSLWTATAAAAPTDGSRWPSRSHLGLRRDWLQPLFQYALHRSRGLWQVVSRRRTFHSGVDSELPRRKMFWLWTRWAESTSLHFDNGVLSGTSLLVYLASKLNSPTYRIVNKFVSKPTLLEVKASASLFFIS